MKKNIGELVVCCAIIIVKLNICCTCRGWGYQPSKDEMIKALSTVYDKKEE